MLNVIGAGFGRTGTMSLKTALDQLGCGPCYHMIEVFAHPEHIATWQAAAEGQPVDWEALFEGYQAAVDWPACTFYRQLMELYPQAKVVLTVRDAERWYESVCNTILRATTDGSTEGLPPEMARQRRMVDTLVWQRTFGGRFEDKQHAIAVFEQHRREVEETVPRERLLVYDVREGWEPLCRFLGVAVPAGVPFPALNTTEEGRQRAQDRRRGMVSQ
jgi:hypothetical protein